MTTANTAISALIADARRMGENFQHLECEHLIKFGWVYVLAGDGLIKVGTVRTGERFKLNGPLEALVSRLREIQAMSPTPLVLLRLYTGGPAYERELHKKLASHRVHGEWFDEIVLGELDFTGCPKCERVIVPSDMAAEMDACLRFLGVR